MLQSLEENISSNNILQHPDNGWTLHVRSKNAHEYHNEIGYQSISRNLWQETWTWNKIEEQNFEQYEISWTGKVIYESKSNSFRTRYKRNTLS